MKPYTTVNIYSKPVLSGHSKRRPKLAIKTDYRLMQAKSIAECSMSFIKLPFVFKTCILSFLWWPLRIGFTVKAGHY